MQIVWMCFPTFVSSRQLDSRVQSSRNRLHGCRQTVLRSSGQRWNWNCRPSCPRRLCHVSFNSFLDWCVELAGTGLQPKFLTIDGHPRTYGGVGRATQCLLSSTRWAVMSDMGTSSVPPLVPVSFFQGLGAVVDFVRNVIRFVQLQDETTVGRLPSGHHSVNLITCPRIAWNLPSTVSTEMGVLLRKLSPPLCWSSDVRVVRMVRCQSAMKWTPSSGVLGSLEFR